MNGIVAVLHLWSVVGGLAWIWVVRRGVGVISGGAGTAARRGSEGPRGGGYFSAGSFLAFLVLILALGRPFPWLLSDMYRATSPAPFFMTALFEELGKVGLFLLIVFGSGAAPDRRSGAESAAWIAVGFAVGQNAFYFLRYPDFGMVLRPLLVTGLQSGVAAFWGYWLTALIIERPRRKGYEKGGIAAYYRGFQSGDGVTVRGEKCG